MEDGISEIILAFIDETWVYMLPLFFLFIVKDFISNFLFWIKMKSETISYYAVGGEVFWDDKLQIIEKIGFSKVVLFYRNDNIKYYTVLHNKDYYTAPKKFIGKF